MINDLNEELTLMESALVEIATYIGHSLDTPKSFTLSMISLGLDYDCREYIISAIEDTYRKFCDEKSVDPNTFVGFVRQLLNEENAERFYPFTSLKDEHIIEIIRSYSKFYNKDILTLM